MLSVPRFPNLWKARIRALEAMSANPNMYYTNESTNGAFGTQRSRYTKGACIVRIERIWTINMGEKLSITTNYVNNRHDKSRLRESDRLVDRSIKQEFGSQRRKYGDVDKIIVIGHQQLEHVHTKRFSACHFEQIASHRSRTAPGFLGPSCHQKQGLRASISSDLFV